MVGRTMTKDEQIRVIEDMEDAVNAHDLEQFASYLSDSVIAHTPQGTLRGPAEVKGLFAARIAAFPDFRVDGVVIFSDGTWNCHVARASGTHDGPLKGPGGREIPPTGKSVEFEICGVMRFENGKVVEVREYGDRLALLAQLGVQAG